MKRRTWCGASLADDYPQTLIAHAVVCAGLKLAWEKKR